MDSKRLLLLVVLILTPHAAFPQHWIASTLPAQNAVHVNRSVDPQIVFSEDINAPTLTSQTVRMTGSVLGEYSLESLSYDDGLRQLTIAPTRALVAGEVVSITLTTGIQNAEGNSMPSSFQFRFTAQVQGGESLRDTTTIVSNAPTEALTAGDLDGDGDVDFAFSHNNIHLSLYLNDGTGEFSFHSTVTMEFSSIYGVIVLDYDLDGDNDIICATIGTVELLTNDGLMSYTRQSIPLYVPGVSTNGIRSLIGSDVNGDGYPEIILPNGNNSSSGDYSTYFFLLWNNKNGTFTVTANPSGGGGGYGGIAATDIDNDGDDDLLIGNVSNGPDHSFSVARNDGMGGFSKDATHSLTSFTRSFAPGDFDGDGDMDFAASTTDEVSPQEGKIVLFTNDGSGSFARRDSFSVGLVPFEVQAHDFDGDGDLDLATLDHSSNVIRFMANDGTGSFSFVHTVPVPFQSVTASVADVDGDHDLDILVGSFSSASVSLIRNRHVIVSTHTLDFGMVPFGEEDTLAVRLLNYDSGQSAVIDSVSTSNADFQSVGTGSSVPPLDSLDVPVIFIPSRSRLYDDTLRIYVSQPETLIISVLLAGSVDVIGTLFPDPASHTADSNATVSAQILFDLNTASLPENVMVVHGDRSGVHTGVFTPYSAETKLLAKTLTKPLRSSEQIQVSLTTGIRNSQDDSLAAPYVWNYRIRAYGGSGLFKSPRYSGVTASPSQIVAADFNGDGYDDVAMRSHGEAIAVCLNNGKAQFSVVDTVDIASDAICLAAADFDNDGDIDLAAGIFGAQNIRILLNDGAGTMTALPPQGYVQASLSNLAVGDFNGDGRMDLVASGEWSNSIHIYLNEGEGMFSPAVSFPAGYYTRVIATGDFDGDGSVDVLSSNIDNQIHYLRNDGRGTMQLDTVLYLTDQPKGFAPGDFDGNGLLDFAVALGSESGPPLGVFFNFGNGLFNPQTFGAAGKNAAGLKAVDFDSDGDLDLAVQNSSDNSIHVYTNSNADFSGLPTILSGSQLHVFTTGDFDGDFGIDIAFPDIDPAQIALLLNRRSTPDLAFSPPQLAFPRTGVNRTSFLNLVVFNEGVQDELEVTVVPPAGGIFQALPSSLTVPSMDSAVFIVSFTPDAPGMFSDSLTLQSNDPFNPVQMVPLSGEGVPKPEKVTLLSPPDSAFKRALPIQLRWNAAAEADSYQLLIRQESVSGPIVVSDSGLTGLVRSVSGLEHGTGYFWSVSGLNIAGRGEFSDPRFFTTFPAGPAGLVAAFEDSASVRLTWNRPADPTVLKYFIYRGLSAASLTLIDSTSSANDTTKVNSPLIHGNTYYFRVAFIDSSRALSDVSALVAYIPPIFWVHQSLGMLNAMVLDWGDFDADGDHDLLMSGYDAAGRTTRVFRNNGGILDSVWAITPGTFNHQVEWGDFDNDGDVDILMGNYSDGTGSFHEVYRNDTDPSGNPVFTLMDPPPSG